jgi:hypothetical protein
MNYVIQVAECHTIPMAKDMGVEGAGLEMLLAWLNHGERKGKRKGKNTLSWPLHHN